MCLWSVLFVGAVAWASQAPRSKTDCSPPTCILPRPIPHTTVCETLFSSFISFLCSSWGRSGLLSGGSRCWKVVMLGWFKLESFWAHSSKLMPPSKLGQICYGHLLCPPLLFNGCLALKPHSSELSDELPDLIFSPFLLHFKKSGHHVNFADLVALYNPAKIGTHRTFLLKLVCLKWIGSISKKHNSLQWWGFKDCGCLCLFLCGKCFV